MQLISQYQELIKNSIENNHFQTLQPGELYAPCDYILNIGGKRLRPVMCLLGNWLFDGDDTLALKPALAIEYFHNFTLMHDDIMDDAPLRRGQQTVHLKYDLNTGILSGDALLIHSYQLLEDLPAELFKPITQLFSKTAVEVCEGQQLDVNFENRNDVNYQEYIKMISLKTGVLVAAALKMGAMIAGADESNAQNLYDFGLNLGIAFQLKDDYLDVFGEEDFGKKQAGDIYENKKTILYIKALELVKNDDLNELKQWYSIETESSEKIHAVTRIFKNWKIDEATMQLIESYTQKALASLDAISVSEDKKKVLKELAINLIDRKI